MSIKRTITLTSRPPVRIVADDWPIVATGRAAVDSRNGTPLPNYERAEWTLRVRQHSNGRSIVYGVADPPSDNWPTHGCVAWKGGEIVEAGADVVPAIERVGRDLVNIGGAPESVIRECIADLPAEDLL